MADLGPGADLLRPANEKWNLVCRPVPLILSIQTVLAHIFTVIGGEDDDCIVENASFFQRIKNTSDIIVNTLNQTSVMRLTLFHRLFSSPAVRLAILR